MNASADVQLLLIGPTGQGRSATGNSILGRNAFISSSSPSSLTSTIECQLSEFNSRRVKVVDGPGVGITHLNKKKAVHLHKAAMEYAIAANHHGYDAFLLVVRFGKRYTTEITETFDCLRKIFGEDFIKNFCILAVTCGDLFKQETGDSRMSVEEWIDEHPGVLRDLMYECKRRVVLFDNLTTDGTTRYQQVEQLLKIVDDLKSEGTRYSDDNFAHAREGRQRYIVETQKGLIQEEAILEENLILKGVEDVQSVSDLETKMVQLWSLQIRGHNLSTKISSLDNDTGVLKEMIGYVKWVQRYVDDQIKFHLKMVNDTEMIKKQTESIHLMKGLQQIEDNDTTTAKELWSLNELKTTNKRQESEKILIGEETREDRDKKELETQIQPQDEPNNQQMVYQDTETTESEETSVCRVSHHNLGTACNKIQMADSKQVDLLLIGHTGMGISETGNSILRRRAFQGRCTTCHVTKIVDSSVSEFNGRVIRVVDSPGIDELGKMSVIPVIRAMETAMAINSHGYNAFLLVFRYAHRLNAKYQYTIVLLKEIFGQDFVKHFCILILTGGDCFEHDHEETDKYIQQWCNEQEEEFKDLVKECENKIVVFDNLTRDLAKKNAQIENLLKVVDNLSCKGQKYTAENFKLAKEQLGIKHTG